jgi:hypothetical protein
MFKRFCTSKNRQYGAGPGSDTPSRSKERKKSDDSL